MPSEIPLRKELPELKKQVGEASQAIGVDLIPPSETDGIFSLSLNEIKAKYKERYDMYLTKLRKERGSLPAPSEEELMNMKKWLSALNSLDSYIQSHKEENNVEKTLREHQVTVFESLRAFLEQGGREGYIKLPTGYGKTVIFTEFLQATGLKSLIVVPRKLLVEQTQEAFEEFAEDIDVGRIYSEAKEHGKDVTIITYDSLLSQLKNKTINPDDYDCLILDEVHRSLSDARKKAVGEFPGTLKLGFTATPVFTEQKQVGNLLATEIHTVSIREAVDEGALSPFSVMAVRTAANLSNVRVTSGGEYDEKDLARAVNIETRNMAAVKMCVEAFANYQTVAYCVGVAHAERLASMLNEAGVSSAAISGNTPSGKQRELKRQLASGEIKVLCNADILIEGFDVPKSSVCLNLRPTLSRVVAEQRGGRVLRLDASNPQKHAFIVEFIDRDADGNDLRQILFSEIAQGAFFPGPARQESPREEIDLPPGVRRMADLRIDGLSIVFSADEIMRVTREMGAAMEFVPERWLTCAAWAKELGIGNHTLQTRISLFLQTREGKVIRQGKYAEGGWFANYTVQGGDFFHYSPEFRTAYEGWWKTQEAPESWWRSKMWAKQLGIKGDTLQKRINLFLQTNEGKALQPGKHTEEGHYANYTVQGGDFFHYSPEFRTAYEGWWKTQEAPESWWRSKMWAKQLGIKGDTLQKRINLFLQTNEGKALQPGKHTEEGHYAIYTVSGGDFTHYSPEFRAAYEKWWKTQEAPENWWNCEMWAKQLGITHETLQKRINLFLQTNEGKALQLGKHTDGGHYAKYKTKSGDFTHYSLEFRAAFHKYFRK